MYGYIDFDFLYVEFLRSKPFLMDSVFVLRITLVESQFSKAFFDKL